jgi:hypothetical protein
MPNSMLLALILTTVLTPAFAAVTKCMSKAACVLFDHHVLINRRSVSNL